MYSPDRKFFPTQKLLQPVTELTNRLPAMQFSLSSFASHQLVTESTDFLSCAITVLPLFNTGQYRNRPADPPGDHLVSRPVTKFSGQPSLPVYWLQSIAGYRELL